MGVQQDVQRKDELIADLERRLNFIAGQMKKCKNNKYRKKFAEQRKGAERDLDAARHARAKLPWSIPPLGVQLCCNFITGKNMAEECKQGLDVGTTHPLVW